MQKLTLTSRAFYNVEMLKCLEYFSRVLSPGKYIFSSGGCEAVETAIKFARRWGYNVKGIPDG